MPVKKVTIEAVRGKQKNYHIVSPHEVEKTIKELEKQEFKTKIIK